MTLTLKLNILPSLLSKLAVCLLLASCAEDHLLGWADSNTGDPIEVGVDVPDLQISSEVTPLSRATGVAQPAELVSWLVPTLKKGLDITYGEVGNSSTERTAILQLQGGTLSDLHYDTNPVSGYAVYTFNYRSPTGEATDEKARWYDNGPHYFEGVHVPNRIRYKDDPSELETDRTLSNGVDTQVAKVERFTTNQSNGTNTGEESQWGNYTLLSHYLGMPANTRISATVSRILLPFRHRLCHVLAYIIIDPTLEAEIKGYDKTVMTEMGVQGDDPNTSSIRFCNVDVLRGVQDIYDPVKKTHTLTPEWAESVRKVVPHYYGEIQELVAYEGKKETYYPKSEGFATLNNAYIAAYNAAIAAGKTENEAVVAATQKVQTLGYTRKVYQCVPVYDLIARPTYTSYDNVMYDERGYTDYNQRTALANRKNKIDFLITLDNGLTYEKEFVFDLDANYETIVYLHIKREGIDYKSSGSDKWLEQNNLDEWYGVDNKNGHTLSQAGSSWQRAFTRRKDSYINDGGDKVTDGGFYDEGTTGQDDATGQYLSEKTWIKYLLEAYKGGPHHGDYFNLSKDITIDARLLPDNFVFTGHLDAFGQDDRQYHTITLTHTGEYWKEYLPSANYTESQLYSAPPAVMPSNDEGTLYHLPKLYVRTAEAEYYVPEDLIEIDGVTYVKNTVIVQPSEPPVYNLDNAIPAKVGDLKTPAQYALANITVKQLMTTATTYYTRSGTAPNYTYTAYTRPAVLYYQKERKSGTALFAGLNGVYSTIQEDTPGYKGPYEANVHKEGAYWIPYKDAATNTGWRAEVLNLTVVGAKLFSDGAVKTGNVENCKENGTTRVPNHRPALPVYK